MSNNYTLKTEEIDREFQHTLCFLETQREIIRDKLTGAYHHLAYYEDGEPVPDIINKKPVPEKAEIKKLRSPIEKIMDDNTHIQSIKVEIKVQE